MPNGLADTSAAGLRQAEIDVVNALGSMDLDFRALSAVSNIFRVATAVRNHFEQSVLSEQQLSWSAFVALFVLRVWGEQESSELADQIGISGGTLTGVLKTLEKKGLAERRPNERDRRRVLVSLTPEGLRVIEEIMPLFNHHEALVTRDLSPVERDQMASYLRRILRTLEEMDHPGSVSAGDGD